MHCKKKIMLDNNIDDEYNYEKLSACIGCSEKNKISGVKCYLINYICKVYIIFCALPHP